MAQLFDVITMEAAISMKYVSGKDLSCK